MADHLTYKEMRAKTIGLNRKEAWVEVGSPATYNSFRRWVRDGLLPGPDVPHGEFDYYSPKRIEQLRKSVSR